MLVKSHIPWAIKIENYPEQSNTLIYNGEIQSPEWKYFDSEKMEIIGGTFEETTAGTYYREFKPLRKYVFPNGTKKTYYAPWIIKKKENICSLSETSGEVKVNFTRTFTVSRLGDGVITVISSNENICTATVNDCTVTIHSHTAGTAQLTITVNEGTNYLAYDLKYDVISTRTQISIPLVSNTSLTYNTTSQSPTITNVPNEYVTLLGNKDETIVGDYEFEYQINDTNAYEWEDGTKNNKKYTWKITPYLLNKVTGNTTSFTYNKTNQSVSVNNFLQQYITADNDLTKKDAGNYTAKYIIKDKHNYNWEDNTTDDININWTINVLKLNKPVSSNTSLTFNNTNQTLSVSNFNTNYITQVGNITEKIVGNYSVTYSLDDKINVNWSDNTTNDVTINWKINILSLAIPSQTTTQRYTGSSVTSSWNNYNTTYMTIDGTTSAITVGTYNVTFALKDTVNTQWSDGAKTSKNVNWILSPYLATIPSQHGTLTYNTASQTPSWNNYDSSIMNIGGTYQNQTNVNSYNATFDLKDKTNYIWSDNTTTNKTVSWTIDYKYLTIPYIVDSSYTYERSSQTTAVSRTITINNFDSTYANQSGTVTASNANTYTVTWTVKNNNIRWSDYNNNTSASRSETWVINKRSVSYSIRNTSFTYDGNSHVPSTDFDDYYVYTNQNNSEQTNANENGYTLRFNLRDTSNTTWWDNTTSYKDEKWYIYKKQFTKPSLSTSSYTYTRSDESTETIFTPEIRYFDSDSMNKSGDLSKSAAGSYNISISLKNTNNTKWNDNTTAAISLPWTINKRGISAPYLYNTSLSWNGDNQTVSGPNTTYINYGGTTTASKLGSYTCTASLKSTSSTYWSDTNNSNSRPLTWIIKVPSSSYISYNINSAEVLIFQNSSYRTNSIPVYKTVESGNRIDYYFNPSGGWWSSYDQSVAAVLSPITLYNTDKIIKVQSGSSYTSCAIKPATIYGTTQWDINTFNTWANSSHSINYDSAVKIYWLKASTCTSVTIIDDNRQSMRLGLGLIYRSGGTILSPDQFKNLESANHAYYTFTFIDGSTFTVAMHLSGTAAL